MSFFGKKKDADGKSLLERLVVLEAPLSADPLQPTVGAIVPDPEVVVRAKAPEYVLPVADSAAATLGAVLSTPPADAIQVAVKPAVLEMAAEPETIVAEEIVIHFVPGVQQEEASTADPASLIHDTCADKLEFIAEPEAESNRTEEYAIEAAELDGPRPSERTIPQGFFDILDAQREEAAPAEPVKIMVSELPRQVPAFQAARTKRIEVVHAPSSDAGESSFLAASAPAEETLPAPEPIVVEIRHEKSEPEAAVEVELAAPEPRPVETPIAAVALENAGNRVSLNRIIFPDQYFYIRDGQVAKTVHQLALALEKMDNETFRHHAHKRGINDFANWIRGVFGYHECADAVMTASEKDQMRRILERYVY